VFQTTIASLEEGALPIVLGGDHSLGAGSVAASAAFHRKQGQRVGLIWVDAHADMNRPDTTQSGNVHGMPLAALLGPEPAELARIGGEVPAVLTQHTVLVGLRNLDDIEKHLVRQSQVHVFTMKDIDRLGIAQVMEKALAMAGDGTGGIHVSFDMDVCDPSIAPGVGTAVRGGLNYREAHVVMELIAESGHLTALDLVEVNPTLDLRNTTAELGTELALSAMGKQIL
jgi:arginase